MENAVYIGLSRQMAMRRQMDVIANNLANMNTAAFKNERVLFEEYLVKPARGQQFSFVQDYGVMRNMKEGQLRPTGNPLDVAIRGKAFFVVETDQGPRYTRNGQFRLDDTGRLTTAEGHPVLDQGGQPVQLDAADGAITIARDGTISNAAGNVARLDMREFENDQQLRKTGASLYATDVPGTPSQDSHIAQGMIESSNVEPIVEMTSMIELMRSYQSTQRMLETDQDLQRKAIERLAKVG